MRRKHGLDLLLTQGSLIGIAVVKDAGEIHEEKDVLKICADGMVVKGSVQIQLPHDLIKQSIIFLGFRALQNTLFCSCCR